MANRNNIPCKSLLYLIVILISFTSNAQEDIKPISSSKNAIYIEFFGNGFYPSINYERSLFSINNHDFRFRVGLSYIPNFNQLLVSRHSWNLLYSADTRRIFTIPLELCSSNKKFPHFEYGLGFTPQIGRYYSKSSGETWKDGRTYNHFSGIAFRIGYRYESPSGHFLMRLGFTPYLTNGFDDKFKNLFFIPMFGYSLGYMF